nr:hypothetical protein [Anaerolineae bacterium]
MGKKRIVLDLNTLVLVIIFAGVFAMALRAPVDTDMFWHLRAGQWEVENGAILRTDVFSYTRSGEDWINVYWLSQVILYGLYRLLGDVGLGLFTALLAAAGMAFVYRMGSGNAVFRGFPLVIAASAAAIFWSPRPQMFSFLFSAVMLYLLWLYFKRGVDRLWWIPVIMVLWVNLHGGFAIGFILLALTAIGLFARCFFADVVPMLGTGQFDRHALVHGLKPVLRLAIIGLVSVIALSVNPYGPQMILLPFKTVGIGVLQDFINEWSSPDFHRLATWPFIWLMLGTLAAAAFSPKKLDWVDAVLVTGTAYAALLAGRNIATFAIVAAPVLMEHLTDWLSELGVRLNLQQKPGRAMLALNWVLVLVVLALVVIKGAAALNPETLDTLRHQYLPVDAVEYLNENQLPEPLFNSYNWGGYLIWQARGYKVYVDGRTDLYDDEILTEYLAIYFAHPGWETGLEAAGIHTVLVEVTSPLARVLAVSDGWDEVYTDEQAGIYVRDGG